MGDEIPDKIRRAFVRLDSLRRNLPDTYNIPEHYVKEYHEALKHLDDLGFDVAEFEIPDHWLEKKAIGKRPTYGSHFETQYSKEREVTRSQFLTKLDAAIGYFTFPEESKSQSIGFAGPKQS